MKPSPAGPRSSRHHLGEWRWPADIAIADFNKDGRPDVMTANGADLSVLLGTGSSALASPIHSGAGSGHAGSISLGDIDGDGNLDMITHGGPSLIVLKGQGDGSFVPSTPIDMSNGIDYFHVDSAVVGDVNGDGNLDLVAVGTPLIRISDVAVIEGNTSSVNATFVVTPTHAIIADGLGVGTIIDDEPYVSMVESRLLHR